MGRNHYSFPRASHYSWGRMGLERPNSTDELHHLDVIARAATGERPAIEQLVRELSPCVQARVTATLWKFGHRSRAEVEDLTQDVFIELLSDRAKVLSTWEPRRGLGLKGFVGLVAQRLTAAKLCTRSRRAPELRPQPELEASAGQEAPSLGPEQAVAAREYLRIVLIRVEAKLSAKGLEMFHRLYVQQQAPELIASELETTVEAVYQWRTRLSKVTAEIERELSREFTPASSEDPAKGRTVVTA